MDHNRKNPMLTRNAGAISTVIVGLFVAGCGSSTNTSTTSPSTLSRCSVAPTGTDSFPAGGGNGTINVTAARECAWTASVEGQWLSIKSGATGQGDGLVEFPATSNPDPVTRRGAVLLNDKRM